MSEPAETIVISEFKAKCLAILRRVHRTGRPVIITRRGERIAEIHPPAPRKAESGWLDCMAGEMEIVGDIMAPVVPAEEWDIYK